MLKKLKRQQGFTLIELIIVIAIIAVLVLLAAPKFMNYVQEARLSRIRNDIRATEAKIDEYRYKLPEELASWELKSLEELGNEVDGGFIYNRKELVDTIPSGDFYKVPKDFIKDETGSSLKGEFYANKDGDVLYKNVKAGK